MGCEKAMQCENSKRAFGPEDLAEIGYVSELSVAPDGAHSAFTRYRADRVKNAFVPAIYLLDNRTGEEHPMSGVAGCRPLYTERGVYFVSEDSGWPQVWLFDGAEARQVTRLRHGVKDFAVAPGGKLAVTTPLWPGEDADLSVEMTREQKEAWEAERALAPIIADDFIYKLDSAFGMLDGSVTRVAIVENGAARIVSEEGVQCAKPAWLPDGRLAYFACPYAGVEALTSELFLWDGAVSTKLTDHMYVCDDVPVQFAGGIIFSAYKVHESGGFSEWLYAAREGAIVPLFSENAPEVCHGVNSLPVSRSVFGAQSAYYQVADGWVYFLSCWQGMQRLFRLRPDGRGQVEPVETGSISVHSFAVRGDGSLLLIGGDLENPADVYRWDGALTRLTCSNAWLSEVELAPTHWQKLQTGDTRMDVWVVEPCGRQADKRYPAVLDIHGGPECSCTGDFWHEYRALSAAGIAVVYCNPRGGTGYGIKHMQGDSAYGQEAWDDLMSAVDWAIGLGFVDPDRIGVTGGSYGGYMTVKLIAKSKRFRAAVGQRLLCNTATSYGTGDMGFASARQSPEKVNIKEYLMKRAERSLIRWVDDIDVPLLLLHGYKDYRCSFEQSEQLFVALHERKPHLPVRMVMFPEENHGVTRTGKPIAQIRHLMEIRDWFAKHLGEGGEAHA